MGAYRHVTFEDRISIKNFLDCGLTQSAIACQLGFDKSTISREIKRNRGLKGYRPKQAQAFAVQRQAFRHTPRKMTVSMKANVSHLLAQQWSPEQISERLKLEGQPSVSHERIYQFCYDDFLQGGSLYKNLRFSHRRRKPRFPRAKNDRRGMIKDAVSIEMRSKGANNRTRAGHWERDLMLGANRSEAILLLTDRKTREVRLAKVGSKSAAEVMRATLKALKGKKVKSITNDRGQEFSEHKKLAKMLNTKIFFCHPYTSSERGSCENRIGILRQYLPKGASLKDLHPKILKRIEERINSRPMKCLGWRTPYEIIYDHKVALSS